MRVSDFKIPFALQEEVIVAGDSNSIEGLWNAVGVLWGKIEPQTPSSSTNDLEGNISHIVTTRYRDDVSVCAGMRLIFNDRAFYIHAIQNVEEANKLLRLYVQEGQFLNQ